VWDAHLEIASGNEASPEDGHDIARSDPALPNELGAEPEPLNEHAHHDEVRDSGAETPDASEGPSPGLEGDEGLVGACLLEALGVECLDSRHGGEASFGDGGSD